jgi:protein involved in polysaccharide export with SLBB domain
MQLHHLAQLLSAMTALVCVGCDQAEDASTTERPRDATNDARIAPGGLLSIKKGEPKGSTTLHGDWPVSSEGEVTLPFLGTVQVAGLTRTEAVSRIASAYEATGIHPDPTHGVLQSK